MFCFLASSLRMSRVLSFFSDALGLLQMRGPQARKMSQIIVSRYFVTHRINHSTLFMNHIDDYV